MSDLWGNMANMTIEPRDSNLPEPQDDGTDSSATAVVLDEDGVLVVGDDENVRSYISGLTSLAKDAVSVAGVSKKSVADGAALATAAAGMAASAGQYVKLSPASMDLLRTSDLIPGQPGFYLSTLRQSSSNLFAGQLQWQPVALGPTQLASAQMLMMMIALRTAIASVEDAVARVDTKVTAILQLAEAERVGEIIGLHRTLSRMADQFEETGRIAQADWDSIAALGPDLERAISKLRSFVARSLKDFDPSASIGDRSKFLETLVDQKLMGESLQLLVVAQDALYKWNQLKIARIEATEPENLLIAIESMRSAIRADLQADAGLMREAQEVLDNFSVVRPLEFLRRSSAKNVRDNAQKLKTSIDEFAAARQTQLADWTDHEIPDFDDAVGEVKRLAAVGVDAVEEAGAKALDAGYSVARSFGSFLQRSADRREAERDSAHAAGRQRLEAPPEGDV